MELNPGVKLDPNYEPSILWKVIIGVKDIKEIIILQNNEENE